MHNTDTVHQQDTSSFSPGFLLVLILSFNFHLESDAGYTFNVGTE